MSHAQEMSPTAAAADDDDWETADLSTFAPRAVRSVAPKTLQATAPAFRPRTAGPSATISEHLASGPPGRGPTAPVILVRGQEDEWFRGPPRETNRQIWDTANRSSAPTLVAPGPPAKVQILRRPTDNAARRTHTASSAAADTKTLSEREEAYRLARERIFGPEAGGGEASPAGRSPKDSPDASGRATPGTARETAQPPEGVEFDALEAPLRAVQLDPAENRWESGRQSAGAGPVSRQPRGPSGGGFGR
ncbi:hypothetical protein Q5752_005166 [Cryptotrichosporon argae]